MTHIIQPTMLFSNRLILRSYQNNDENILFPIYFGDPAASKYLQRCPHKDIAQTKKALLLWAKQKWEYLDSEFMWIIANRITQQPMGILIFMQQQDIGEIHFGLVSVYQNQGFMQEAITTALLFFRQTSKLRKIETFSAIDNISSRKALEKSGFNQVQFLPSYAIFPNISSSAQDCMKYHLLFN